MPKHNRTRKQRARRADPWAAGITELHEEAAGLMQLHIIPPQDVLPLIASAMAGNALAGSLLNPVMDTIRLIETAPQHSPMECGFCGRALHRGDVLCVALPHRPYPTKGLAFALCGACTINANEVHAKAIAALQILWPEGRTIEITHPAGGAA